MDILLAHCSATFSEHSSLFITLFLGGLTGGFTHCLAMCGPFASCGAMCGSCKVAEGPNRSEYVALPYHLGRITTYSLLGLLVASVAHHISSFSFWAELAATFLVLAGLMFIASSLSGIVPLLRQHPAGPVMAMVRIIAKLSNSRLNFSQRQQGYIRGTLLGFMPCGLLYAALMMVAASANPLTGLFGMALFTLGTVPALLIASLGVGFLSQQWHTTMQRLSKFVLAYNGIILFIAAGKLMM